MEGLNKIIFKEMRFMVVVESPLCQWVDSFHVTLEQAEKRVSLLQKEVFNKEDEKESFFGALADKRYHIACLSHLYGDGFSGESSAKIFTSPYRVGSSPKRIFESFVENLATAISKEDM